MAPEAGHQVDSRTTPEVQLSRSSRRLRPAPSTQRFAGALLGAILVLTALTAAVPAAGAEPAAGTPPGGIRSTIHYEEAVAHQDDQITFEPGGRVTVGFTPRAGDRFLIGGERPRPLPAGRVTGRAMRGVAGAIPGDQGPGSPESGSTGQLSPPPSTDEPGVLGPGGPSPTETPALTATPAPTAEPTPTAQPTEGPPLDRPVIDPATVIQATESAVRRPGALEDGAIDLQATVNPAGLRKEVFGFLPYWELNSSTVLDWTKLSTIAFFGVGASAAGNLEKTTSTGSTTVGWSGWTSSRMTDVINEAHRNDTRVVLTIQSFGWSSAGLTKQKTLLGSSTARANLARQIAATVRDRGADGVNLDFEPLASGYDDEFTSLVRRIRTELDAVHKGYQLTFDTTGWIGNYPVADATAAGGADAIFIMGYDYRNGSASTVGSIAPIGGPAYDIRDTIAAYTARVSPSKLILGVPYYGRAWSTDTDKLGAKNISGTKYGASATVIYDSAVDYLADKGRRYDPVEGVAWTVYRRENCTTTYGCVTPWRQLYVDDAEALKAKYDLVNQYGLRGAGIWALGYDGSRKELWTAIRDKFITDTTPPRAGIRTLSATQSGEAFTVDWSSDDDFGVVSHDVDVSIDGGAWARWLTETPTPVRHLRGGTWPRVRLPGARPGWQGQPVRLGWRADGRRRTEGRGRRVRHGRDRYPEREGGRWDRQVDRADARCRRPGRLPPGTGVGRRLHLVPRRRTALHVADRRCHPHRPVGGRGHQQRHVRQGRRAAEHDEGVGECHARAWRRRHLFPDDPGPAARYPGRQWPVGRVQDRGRAQLRRGRPGVTGTIDRHRGDRQPDDHPPDERRLRQPRADDELQAQHLDPQRAAGRQPGQRGDGQALGQRLAWPPSGRARPARRPTSCST